MEEPIFCKFSDPHDSEDCSLVKLDKSLMVNNLDNAIWQEHTRSRCIGTIKKKKKKITSVQPDEADEMADSDADADVTVQSGHRTRRRMFPSPKKYQRGSKGDLT